jgi:hypothetical protein
MAINKLQFRHSQFAVSEKLLLPLTSEPPRNLLRFFARDVLLGASICKGAQQISYGKQGEAESSTPEIEVMANTIFEPPTHPGEKTKCFADVSQDDYHQTSCAE